MTRARDFPLVHSGPVADIRLSPVAKREYDKVCAGRDERSIRQKTHLERYFKHFCECEPHHLNVEKFKKQGNFADGKGGRVAIWEFKAWQWRLYGAVLQVEEKKCFVGVRVDPEKKKDRADKALLEATANDISKLPECK